ncbi:diguanylate cyclase [Desulfoplanes formicivorans]|uniref:diguanylate cyclase n=2 Tax=Desulfoplanes formicivorans TaxID=1592317 RepID=A0A194AKL8_9BACT|nr:diguanylate cyclase [Desulfoplanes formicivorans]
MTPPESDREERIWIVGMKNDEIQAALHPIPYNIRIQHQTVNELTNALQHRPHEACLTLITQKAWAGMSKAQRRIVSTSEACRLVLMLEENDHHVRYDIEEIVSQQFICALRMPLTTDKLNTCLKKTREMLLMCDDLYNMANEIILERELLARKNEQLDFLNKILTKASKSLDPGTIISQAGRDLNILLEVTSIMGVFWNIDAPAFLSAEIFTPPNLDKQQGKEWVGYLLDQAERTTRHSIKTYHVESLEHDQTLFHEVGLPDQGNMIKLPMIWNDKTFGILFIVSPKAALLGRDRVKVLQAVGNHLALALRNALLYRRMQNQADHDGLTRINNRQNFEKQIVKELHRHQRYQHELSLLMLDLDHFKQINDKYGHLAGDMVLREVADILRNAIRDCDFPARYGGEEFVIILPHTEEKNAWILAERIRQEIAAHTFRYNDHSFQITACIGISSIKPRMLKPAEYLVSLADQALYKAKTSGRNMVCRSAPMQEHSCCVNDAR